jgi:RNA polymerase sigma-70 factor (sigma-E family)
MCVTIEEFVATRGTGLLRSAFLLTGDRHRAEDLVQSTLAKVWPKWEAVVARGRPDAYVRRTLLTTYLSWRRRPSYFERPVEAVADPVDIGAADTDLRLLVVQALAQLPRRQRATVVLRYFEDLSEAQTAEALGCSVGTVKSQTAKALRTLRAHLDGINTEVMHDGRF